jgi:hypothetical protein
MDTGVPVTFERGEELRALPEITEVDRVIGHD